MTAVTDLLVEEARAVSVLDGYRAAGGTLTAKRGLAEITGPCRHGGGTDAFSINPGKNSWNCRKCGHGGRDGLSIAAHELGFDLHERAQFLECCSTVTGKPIPDEAGETPEQREARLAELERRRAENEKAEAERQAAQTSFRDRERQKARGIYERALPIDRSVVNEAFQYLRGRCAAVPPGDWLRLAGDVPYWHGQDERGQPIAIHSGPAMIAPFLGADREIVGCHITWIDLTMPRKLRPLLYGLTKSGREAGRPEWHLEICREVPTLGDLDRGYYEQLPTKKMRGTKKGGLIPIAGHPDRARWLGGEGIENVVAVAGAEGFRGDTFYFAAGDLGNLAGPALSSSRFKHPSATKPDKNGKERPVMVAGPEPDPERLDEGFPVGRHVTERVLVADGDSEPVMTAAAMVRARARIELLAPGCVVPVLWPPQGAGDFAELMTAGLNEQRRAG